MTEIKPPAPLSRETLHAISAEFLSSDKLRSAPLEEKKEFLRIKGLSDGEIDHLLRKLEKENERVGTPSDRSRKRKEKKERRGEDKRSGSEDKRSGSEDREGKTEKENKKAEDVTALVVLGKKDGENGVVPKGLKEIEPVRPSTPVQQQPAVILTYPEYIAPPPAPPAPVNAQSLVRSMYVAGGVATAIYGTSKYFLQPMYDSLVDARLDLAQTALTNLTSFNSKLSALVPNRPRVPSYANVSTATSDPNQPRRSKKSRGNDPKPADSDEEYLSYGDDGDDGNHDSDSDSDSDSSTSSSRANHLFHVDASTQTVPELSDPSAPFDDDPLSPETKLAKISAHLATLIDSHSDDADEDLRDELEGLAGYLDTLRYDANSLFPNSFPSMNMGTAGKDDMAAKLKAEIRSMKGSWLNSKNFPLAR